MNKKKCLISIVEDDIPCGKLLEYYLRRNGFNNVALYTDENNFIHNLNKHPQIVITDYRLKATNGVELIRHAKKIYPDFYCILFTGLNYDEICQEDKSELLIDKYIRKGLYSLTELLTTLNTYSKTQFIEQFY